MGTEDPWWTTEPVSVLGTVYGVSVALAAGVLLPGFRLDASLVPQVGLAAVLLLLVVGMPSVAAFLAGRVAAVAVHALALVVAVGMIVTSAPPLPTAWALLLAAVGLYVGYVVLAVAVGRRPVRPLRRDVRRVARRGLEGVVAGVGLAVVTRVTEVAVYPAPLGYRLLALVVSVSLFTAIALPPAGWFPRDVGGARGMWRALAALIVADLGCTAVKLGMIWWAATVTAVPLSFGDVGAFAVTTLVLAGLMHPFRSRSR